ncbi:hypothetical protein ANME2D_00829 [Candidatus Methanoperedens nitroreducens]|uniref:Uncharacterized protein n=1 Tax=Candidatus Methanoperedens nitratireducens TaxID=1392998 RepID=A0A062V513_9EURY|nr:PCYCGC motif-containing (lipo)protein [Candidatus Methanoperedens nitroreducens]KCZ72402.1 hypothetical protein ANME2D_00829 [Candidatus Methanoperedens nitroreducens]MDJ1423664.1 PCYCGC motif-containing (lipo)protein [Candidatus Methanoperedens sp.]
MKLKYMFSVIAAVAVLVFVYTVLVSGFNGFNAIDEIPQENITNKIGLPEFTQKTVRVEEAYIYAMMNQDKVMYLACYCGCAGMQHSDKLLKHGSLKDCYIRPDGSFEPHASECKLCNDITLEAKELIDKGYSLKDVRKIIDDEYSGRGVGTDTSLPP